MQSLGLCTPVLEGVEKWGYPFVRAMFSCRRRRLTLHGERGKGDAVVDSLHVCSDVTGLPLDPGTDGLFSHATQSMFSVRILETVLHASFGLILSPSAGRDCHTYRD